MTKYKVPVVWEQVSYAYVEAESIDEAYKLVEEEPWEEMLDMAGEYVQGSYEVDLEGIYEVKNED